MSYCVSRTPLRVCLATCVVCCAAAYHTIHSVRRTLSGVPYIYSKTCLKRNLKGPEHFSAKARFPFNQGTLHTV